MAERVNRIVWSKNALRDIKEIFEYWNKTNGNKDLWKWNCSRDGQLPVYNIWIPCLPNVFLRRSKYVFDPPPGPRRGCLKTCHPRVFLSGTHWEWSISTWIPARNTREWQSGLVLRQPPPGRGSFSIFFCLQEHPENFFSHCKTFSWHFLKLSLGLYQQLFFEMIWTDATWCWWRIPPDQETSDAGFCSTDLSGNMSQLNVCLSNPHWIRLSLCRQYASFQRSSKSINKHKFTFKSLTPALPNRPNTNGHFRSASNCVA